MLGVRFDGVLQVGGPSLGREGVAGAAADSGALGRASAQVVGDSQGEVDERHLERPGDGGDHLARRLFEPALDLGEVLG